MHKIEINKSRDNGRRSMRNNKRPPPLSLSLWQNNNKILGKRKKDCAVYQVTSRQKDGLLKD